MGRQPKPGAGTGLMSERYHLLMSCQTGLPSAGLSDLSLMIWVCYGRYRGERGAAVGRPPRAGSLTGCRFAGLSIGCSLVRFASGPCLVKCLGKDLPHESARGCGGGGGG